MIPCDISNKIILSETSPPGSTTENHIKDEELVNWGDDEEDFIAEDFEDDENFLEDVNLPLEAPEDTLQVGLAPTE